MSQVQQLLEFCAHGVNACRKWRKALYNSQKEGLAYSDIIRSKLIRFWATFFNWYTVTCVQYKNKSKAPISLTGKDWTIKRELCSLWKKSTVMKQSSKQFITEVKVHQLNFAICRCLTSLLANINEWPGNYDIMVRDFHALTIWGDRGWVVSSRLQPLYPEERDPDIH